MGDIQENGGLVDDREVTDTVVDLPQNLKMNLKDARNVFKGNTLYYTQNLRHSARESRFPRWGETIADVPAVFIGNAFNFTKFRKTYTDTRSSVEEGFTRIGT